MNGRRFTRWSSGIVWVIAVLLAFTSIRSFHTERDLPAHKGGDYWGSQPTPKMKRINQACCENNPQCFGSDFPCSLYDGVVCGGSRSFLKFAVDKRQKCMAGYLPPRWCEEVEDERYWRQCSVSYACTWDQILGQCVQVAGSEQYGMVPPTCEDAPSCPN